MSVSFEKSRADYPKKRPQWTGTPVRKAMFEGSRTEARRLFALEDGTPTILVLGGGTGASALNALVRRALPLLAAEAQVVHVTGKGKLDPAASGGRYHPFEFLTDEMKHAYAAADLCVTRAGIGTLSELAALGVPAAVMPIPGTHQEENARFFAGAGAAVLMDERAMFSKSFADAVLGLLKNDSARAVMRDAGRRLTAPDAAARVAGMVGASAKRRADVS